MTYNLLGQDLHETADLAKSFFAKNYGATGFKCEAEVAPDLPLRPTWQGKLKTGYTVCVNVQPSPFSPTLYEFVSKCASRGLPIKLWTAVPQETSNQSFSGDLKQAREAGIGVVQLGKSEHECHRAVPLSLFALKRCDVSKIPKERRETIKHAESTFLEGAPVEGCNSVCQDLELVTRNFAEFTFNAGWWSSKGGSQKLTSNFFSHKPWANVLEEMETRLIASNVTGKAPKFNRQLVVRVRGYTEWRNAVSHKPKTLKALQNRDAELRTMFEATRNLLVEWYGVVKPFKLLK